MSKAEPMGDSRRAMSYKLAGDVYHRNLTPRQWRRWRHKHNREHGTYFGHWFTDAKRRPTPRQKPRRG